MYDKSLILDPQNSLYMERNFRDWKFKGWARNISKTKFGVEGIDGYDYVTVFVKGYSEHLEGDDYFIEQLYIDNGMYGVVLFYGIDNISYMCRYKQRNLMSGKVDLSTFDDIKLKNSFFYNS